MGSILVPLNDLGMMETYAQAGADEFYLGFYDLQWTSAFGTHYDLNRMSGFGQEANAYSFQEVLGGVQMAKQLGKKVFITFNTAAYGAPAVDMLTGYCQMLAAYGADGIIVSGPELVDNALACGLEVVASTMCGIYNSDIARFYESCGVTRMILPRDVSLAEIESIIASVPDVDYEVFLMRNGCVFSDSNCLGQHGMGHGALCGELRAATRTLRTTLPMDEVELTSNLHCHEFHKHACGLCALWDFEQMGVAAYKIVGRGDQTDAILEDIATVKAELAVAQACATREEYLERMLPHPYADVVCDRGLNCYYPEVGRC